ncbi:MAG: trypsin-like serine protease [Pseudobdellovibrionaceae bacterium]
MAKQLGYLLSFVLVFANGMARANWNGDLRSESKYNFIFKIQAGISCSAFALTDRFVATAAHCFTGFDTSEKKLTSWNGSNGAKASLRFRKLHFHPGFDLKTVEDGGMPFAMAQFDVVLIELAEGALEKIQGLQSYQNLQGITQSQDFFIASLPSEGTLLSLGLGATNDDGDESDFRRSVPLKVASFTDSPLRATSANPNQALCLGDSGGPLLLESTEGTRIVGLLSSRHALAKKVAPCEDSRYEYFEVNLAQHHKWLESVLGF